MASAVSDAGELHFFDTRIGQHDRKNLVIRSGWKQLNTHVKSRPFFVRCCVTALSYLYRTM